MEMRTGKWANYYILSQAKLNISKQTVSFPLFPTVVSFPLSFFLRHLTMESSPESPFSALLAQSAAIQASAVPDSEKSKLLYDMLEQGIRASKQTDVDLILAKKKGKSLSRDIENLYNEIDREKQYHGRLETHCRDMQKEKKALAEEAKRLIEEEEKKRMELTKKVQDTLEDVERKVQESHTEREQLAVEKEELTAEFNRLLALNDQKDKDFQAAMQTKEDSASTERSSMQSRITQMLQGAAGGPEQQLRAQLNEYKQKFESFQQSLVQNNESFAAFKRELQGTQKKIQLKEKENADLKKKLVQSEAYVSQVKGEIEALQAESSTLNKQKDVLAGYLAKLTL